jgi:xyloglucan-specific exo-beta-1,4-glucanase
VKKMLPIHLALGLAAALTACNTASPSQIPNEVAPARSGLDSSTLDAQAINKLIKASGPNGWNNLVQEGVAVANVKYTASFRIKGAGQVTLRFFEGSWAKQLVNLDCSASSVWKTCTTPVQMGANPKFTFSITNSGPASTPTFIDDAALTDATGKNILVNGNFEAAAVSPWWFDPAFTLVTEDTGTPPPPPPPTGTTVWKNVAVGGGGMVTGIAMHPKERNLVYIRTDVGGLYRWNEATSSWTPLFDGFGKAQEGYSDVESLAIDPSNTNVVYAAAGAGSPTDGATAILKSSDRGATWKAVKTDLYIQGNGELRASGERLAVDPNRSSVVYFGSRQQGLWRSSDAGTTWAKVAGLPNGSAPQGVGWVAFDPTSGTAGTGSKRIWVGIAKQGVFQSDDGGTTWRNVLGTPIAGYYMGDVSVTARGTLYSSFLKPSGPAEVNIWVDDGKTPNGVYRLEAGVWTNIAPAAQMNYDGMSASTVAGQDHLLITPWFTAHQYRSAYSSEDGGRTWAEIRMDDNDLTPKEGWYTEEFVAFGHAAAIDPFNPNRAWGLGGLGIWRTDTLRSRAADGSSNAKWTTYANGMAETVDMYAKSLPNGRLINGVSDLSGFVYTNVDLVPDDRSRHYTPIFTTTGIDALSSDPNYLVLVGQDQNYWYKPERSFAGFSTNGGYDWQRFPTLPQSSGGDVRAGRIALGVGDKNNIVWAHAGEGVFATLNGGQTWTKGLIEGTTESFSPMFFYNGPFVSTYLANQPLVADKVLPKTFYAYGDINGPQAKLYRSSNGGLTWKVFSPFSDNKWTGDEHIQTRPGKAGELWAARTVHGLWRSRDGGTTFTKFPGVTNALGVTFGKAAPGRTNQTVYVAGVVNGQEGIWRSVDEGANWVRISTPALNILTAKFKYLEGDVNIFGRVYAVTNGRGTFYSTVK